MGVPVYSTDTMAPRNMYILVNAQETKFDLVLSTKKLLKGRFYCTACNGHSSDVSIIKYYIQMYLQIYRKLFTDAHSRVGNVANGA